MGMASLFFVTGGDCAGNFKENKFSGLGTFTVPDRYEYVGEFENDDFNGQGTRGTDGTIYVGINRKGKPHGKGVMTFPEDGIEY